VQPWITADLSPIAVLAGHTAVINGCTCSPDGRLVASSSDDGTIRLWDVAGRSPHAVLTGHKSWVDKLSFTHDSQLLASTSKDGTLRVWRTATAAAPPTSESQPRSSTPPGTTTEHICAVGSAGTYMLAYRPFGAPRKEQPRKDEPSGSQGTTHHRTQPPDSTSIVIPSRCSPALLWATAVSPNIRCLWRAGGPDDLCAS